MLNLKIAGDTVNGLLIKNREFWEDDIQAYANAYYSDCWVVPSVREVPIDIIPDYARVVRHMQENVGVNPAIADYAREMELSGIPPILMGKNGDYFEFLDNYWVFEAAILLGLKSMPAVVVVNLNPWNQDGEVDTYPQWKIDETAGQ